MQKIAKEQKIVMTGSCRTVEIKHNSTCVTLCAMLRVAISVVTEFIVRKIELNCCELSSGVLSYGMYGVQLLRRCKGIQWNLL